MKQPGRTCILMLAAAVAGMLLPGCFHLLPSDGGGQTTFDAPRMIDARDVAAPDRYAIEAVAADLDFPTSMAIDDRGRLYVTEAGYSYGGVVTVPRLLRIEPDGSHTVIAEGDNPPWNGLAFHDGAFYVAGGHIDGGRLLHITMDGAITPIVEGLPSFGDHHTNGPAIGEDGWIYFGQGTATNSAVVGLDNYFIFGWLKDHPDFHDAPCEDVVLAGRNFTTPNPFTPDEDDEAVTGAYMPFGEPTTAGQVIPGELPCGGAIMRVRPDGTGLEVVAWGLRNPFGMAFAPDGALYITENQFDERGSRPGPSRGSAYIPLQTAWISPAMPPLDMLEMHLSHNSAAWRRSPGR